MQNSRLKFKIKKDIDLAPFTTFGIGGPADYFFEARNSQQIVKAVNWAKAKKLPFYILGGGSNLLVADKGVRGLVIKIQNSKFKIQNEKAYCEGGVMVNRIVEETVNRGLGGLEFFAGLPGTVGGAVYNNSHWKDHFFSDCLEKVEVLNKNLERKVFKKKDLDFSYDWSSLRKKGMIVLSASFKLNKENESTLKRKIKETLKERSNQPKGKSAGCIFKNPKGKSAGYLIDKVGLKGKKIGGVKISERHANFFINVGGGKAEQVVKLIKLVCKKVKMDCKIELEPEIFFLGEF